MAAPRTLVLCRASRRLGVHVVREGTAKGDARIVSYSSLATSPLCAKHLPQMSAYLLFGIASSAATPKSASASLSIRVR